LKIFPKNTIPWLLFSCAAALCLYIPFSNRAINAGSLGKHNMGLAQFFSVTFSMAVYASLAVAVISAVHVVRFRRQINE
jgi:F0F1-type ATP synthase membrane subunit a